MVISIKNTLCPQIFEPDNTLKSNVREVLLKIAKKVIDELEIKIDVDDIILTGSLANFTYTDKSDIDLHIVFDFNQINKDKELVKKTLDCNKFVWNLRHNIFIKKHEVEVYYQDINEPHAATGIYSILNNKWVKEPVRPEKVDIDTLLVKKKYDNYKNFITQLDIESNKEITKSYAEKLHRVAEKLYNKIKEERKEGLDTDGEFSEDNYVFKSLRNSGLLELLKKIILKVYDKSLSESYLMKIMKVNPGTKKRHMHSVGLPGLTRKHPQFVPDMHKKDPGSFSKLEQLKKSQKGKQYLLPSEYKQLQKRYNIDILLPGKHKMLGNTGIKVYFDNEKQRFVLEK